MQSALPDTGEFGVDYHIGHVWRILRGKLGLYIGFGGRRIARRFHAIGKSVPTNRKIAGEKPGVSLRDVLIEMMIKDFNLSINPAPRVCKACIEQLIRDFYYIVGDRRRGWRLPRRTLAGRHQQRGASL